MSLRRGLLSLVLLGVATAAPAAHAADGPLALKRGISIHAWLNWSPVTDDGAYRWPPYRTLEEWGSAESLDRLKTMGFDFVRLSVDPGPLLASKGARQEQAVARLEAAVRAVLKEDLKVILDLHPVGQVKAYSADAIEGAPDTPMSQRYRSAVGAVAAMLARVGGGNTALELMNEPQFYPCDGGGGREWEAVLSGLVGAARAAAPDLTLVVSGACGGNIKGLVQLDPERLGDDRLLYSFHFYEPHSFTHQGVGDARDIKGVPWPADASANALALIYTKIALSEQDIPPQEWSKRLSAVRSYVAAYTAEGWGEKQIAARFGEVRDWAKAHGVPNDRLLLGEFSVISPASGGGALDADRTRWLSSVRQQADMLGIPWAYWAYADADPVALAAIGILDLPLGN